MVVNDAAATSLVRVATRRPALRRALAIRLIAVVVFAVELAWIGGLGLAFYEVMR
jgi:hypothetical protein